MTNCAGVLLEDAGIVLLKKLLRVSSRTYLYSCSISLMQDKEFIIFCDESLSKGQYYSNFYGGLIVGSSKYEVLNTTLNKKKEELNLLMEVKWEKVTANYLSKYQELIRTFFSLVARGDIRVRIMFRQNANKPTGLTADQLNGTYFRLYYQFIKNAFGLRYCPQETEPRGLRLYFDEFPTTKEAAAQFKGFIEALGQNTEIQAAGFVIEKQNIAEIRSHDHVLAQCLDVVLGAMAFRLNDLHKKIPDGAHRRGKRTVAKEKLFKLISEEIRKLRPGFNIGTSTSVKTLDEKWSAPYMHWNFVPNQMDFSRELTKNFNKKSPTKPT